MRSLYRCAFTVLTVAGLASIVAGPARADVVGASADTRIITLGSSPTYAFYSDMCCGAAPADLTVLSAFTKATTDPPNLQRTLVNFDLSGLPAGKAVQSATLTLYSLLSEGYGNNSGVAMSVYRVTRSWTETQVSWNSAAAGQPWTNGGGDAVGSTGVQLSNPYASSTAAPNANDIAVTWDVSTLVSQWYNGTFTNYGLLLVSASPNDLLFRSREYSGGALAPRLDVTFTPEPATMALLLVGGALVAARRRGK